MISFSTRGSFKNTEQFLTKMSKNDIFRTLETYAQRGVNALSRATPKDSGETARSWGYEITKSWGTYRITWINTNVQSGVSIPIILQYGHGTGTGGYVQGYDFINPALRPIFDQISDAVWKAVTSA